MPRLNDLTDITLTGIRGGALGDWNKFSISPTGVDSNLVMASTTPYYDPSTTNIGTDGSTHTVIAGWYANRQVFKKISVTDFTKGIASLTDLGFGNNATTQSIKAIRNFSGLGANGMVFSCRRDSNLANYSYGSAGAHPTIGIISGLDSTASLNLIDSITISSTVYKITLQGTDETNDARYGKTIASNPAGNVIVASAMELSSTDTYKLIYSTDGGTTWGLSNASVTDPVGETWINGFISIIYARDAFYTYYNTKKPPGGDPGYNWTFLKSTDNGQTWNVVGTAEQDIDYRGVYEEFHYIGGNFVMYTPGSMYYFRSPDLINWSTISVLNDVDVEGQTRLYSLNSGTAIRYDASVGKMAWSKDLRGSLDNASTQRGWLIDNKNNKILSNLSGNVYRTDTVEITHHAEYDGSSNLYRYWLALDKTSIALTGSLVLYSNSAAPNFSSRWYPFQPFPHSAWTQVSQVGGDSPLYIQQYVKKNPYSGEFVSFGDVYSYDWNSNSYKTYASTDLLNWQAVTGSGVTNQINVYEPNQGNASWGVIAANKFKVSSTGLSGTFIEATLPADVRSIYNNVINFSAGYGNNWLLSAQYNSGAKSGQHTVLYSTDSGATFTEIPGITTSGYTNRPLKVAYLNGYWVYWNFGGQSGNEGIYYSTDLINWTHNTGVTVGNATYSPLSCSYVDGKYVFYRNVGKGGATQANTDITATSGWTAGNTNSQCAEYDDGHYVTAEYWTQSTLRARAYNGYITNLTDGMAISTGSNLIIEKWNQMSKKNTPSDDLLDTTPPFYLNGYWYVTTVAGNVYRIPKNRFYS